MEEDYGQDKGKSAERIEALIRSIKIDGEEVPDFIPFEKTLEEDGRHGVHIFIYANRQDDALVGLEPDKSARLEVRASILVLMFVLLIMMNLKHEMKP